MFASKTGAARLSIISNSSLIALKVAVGLFTGSISILAEAIHSLVDLLAAFIAFFGIRLAAQPPDVDHPFGHGKAENVSAAVEALLIFAAAGFVIFEAARRLATEVTLKFVEMGIGVMAISALVNLFVSRRLLRVARATDSLALEADARHLTTDVLTSLGVFLGLVAVRLTGWQTLDPLIAIGVALFVFKAAYDVTRRSFGGLLDERLPQEEEALIVASISEHMGEAVSFHELRTRKAGSARYIELHLVMSKDVSLEKAHRMCDHLEADIKSQLSNASVTIHCEPRQEEGLEGLPPRP